MPETAALYLAGADPRHPISGVCRTAARGGSGDRARRRLAGSALPGRAQPGTGL